MRKAAATLYGSSMRIQFVIPVLLGAVVLAGCHKPKPKELNISHVLPNIPLPPDPEPLVRETGTNAMQIVIASRASTDSVVAYYRRVLSTDPFRLINERSSGKTTAFYAEQNGPSIWITVSPNGTQGSLVVIAGANDSTRTTSH